MNKGELVTRVAREAGMTKADVNKAVDGIIDNVTRALKKGEKVTLVGFGTFGISRRRARSVLNPQTGAPIRISARRVAKFTAGKELKDSIK